MKLYAVRDRLIGYFMTPFTAPSDQHAMASLASVVNNLEENHGISQAPSHYELHRLATVDDETGRISGDPEFLCSCNALVRTGPESARFGKGAPEGAPDRRTGPTGEDLGGNHTNARLLPETTDSPPGGGQGPNPRPQ